jgi:hypothetical protein
MKKSSHKPWNYSHKLYRPTFPVCEIESCANQRIDELFIIRYLIALKILASFCAANVSRLLPPFFVIFLPPCNTVMISWPCNLFLTSIIEDLRKVAEKDNENGLRSVAGQIGRETRR